MTLVSVMRREQAIDQLFTLADGLSVGHPLQAHVTQFICVRVSGYIEQSVAEIYYEYARSEGKPLLARFVSRRMERNANPSAENLCQLAGDFDPDWEAELRRFLGENGRKEAVNSVVNYRHRIAHGDSVSFGLWQLKDWYKLIRQSVEFVRQQTAA